MHGNLDLNEIYTSTKISSSPDDFVAKLKLSALLKGQHLVMDLKKGDSNWRWLYYYKQLCSAYYCKTGTYNFLENLLSPNTPDVDAIVCYQLSTKGMAEDSAYGATDATGQISRWYYETVSVKNIYDPVLAAAEENPPIDPKSKITTCNPDISSATSANCTSLGGEFVDRNNEIVLQ